MEYKLRRLDREAVLKALSTGEYEAIATSSHGALDELMHLAVALGVFEALKLIRIHRKRAGIPDDLLLRLAAILPFVEAMGLSAAAGELLKDAAILLELGFSIEQVQNGFNQRHHGGEEKGTKPFHPEVLREELARIDMASLRAFRRACIRTLFERKLVKGRVYAIDGSGIHDQYRLVGLMNVHDEQPLWLNWRLLSGKASEKGKEAVVVREMVEEVLEAGGPDCIEWMLMDALYADGPLLAWLEYKCGIHALVRLPEDRLLYEDLAGLVRAELIDQQTFTDVRYLSGRKQIRDIAIAAVGELSSWPSFVKAAGGYGVQNATLWAALIHSVDREDDRKTETWALASTSPFPDGKTGYQRWRARWRIENNGFRELKEGWQLERAPWSRTSPTVVAARVAFTLIAFNVAQLMKTSKGRQLADRGIRRLRRELAAVYGLAPIVVFAKDVFAVFHIEEIMQLVGLPPQHSLRRQNATGPPLLS